MVSCHTKTERTGMKGSKAIRVLANIKNSKAIRVLAGVLLGLAFLGGLACATAALLMLLWNIVGVAALSIAISLTFLTALKGVGILYGMIIFGNFMRSAVQSYLNKVQIQVAMKMMRQFEDELKDAQAPEGDDDLLQHFRPS